MNENTQIILNALHTLHSIHGDFSERTIADEDVRTILAAAV